MSLGPGGHRPLTADGTGTGLEERHRVPSKKVSTQNPGDLTRSLGKESPTDFRESVARSLKRENRK